MAHTAPRWKDPQPQTPKNGSFHRIENASMKAELENPFLVIDIPRFAVTGHMLTGNVEFLAQLLTAYS